MIRINFTDKNRGYLPAIKYVMTVWSMEPSANLKSQVTRMGKVTLLDSKKNHSNSFEVYKTLP